MNLQPISSIGLFMTHTKSELGMLGIHLWEQNFEEEKKFIFLHADQTINDHFWVLRNLRD
jgi:hypothetical protein